MGFLGKMLILLAVGAFAVTAGWIYLYNAVVNAAHDITLRREGIHEAEVQNAELKNKFFEILEPGLLTELAERRGLVKEKAPQYLEAHSLAAQ